MPCNRRTAGSSSHVLLRTIRPACLGLAKVVALGISAVTAAPTPLRTRDAPHDVPEAEGSALWILFAVSIILVLLGGAFAGLTIALMGQDSIYLQVIARDPEEPQRKNAKRVYDLLGKGKHWVLVTLLLGNVIVNETLPVVLDRCFGGGVAAVVGSTVLIVIFGEILPQSVCVRYGLQIGGYMSTPVLLLMYAMAPVAWPTAKLLDWLLGEDHGTVYKKSGLKTLVTLHKSLGEVSERLNQDEVTIISAVLDLKRKPVEEVMTPMEDVYILSEDTVLDQETIDKILDAGYSRIPIHQTGKPFNFVGMLLVKILITYDPEDAKKVSDFALATLPETRPETSCLDIINFFQEGKSHMVLVSEYPGEDHGALGVVTLEDVIEELIGEEIIDESDVFVDIHKAIRRAHPAPKARYHKLLDIAETEDDQKVSTSLSTRSQSVATGRSGSPAILPGGHGMSLLKRRSSADQNGQIVYTTVPVRANYDEIRDHLRHLGPSNPASNPRATKVSSIKIKDAAHPRHSSLVSEVVPEGRVPNTLTDGADERTSLLSPKVTGKDGIQALARQQSYTTPTSRSPIADQDVEVLQPLVVIETNDEPTATTETTEHGVQATIDSTGNDSPTAVSTTDSLKSAESQMSGGLTARPRTARGHVRSGSITENVIEAGGVRKVVLEASISTENEGNEEHTSSHGRSRSRSTLGVPGRATSEEAGSTSEGKSTADGASNTGSANGRGGGKKKNRRKKRKGGK